MGRRGLAWLSPLPLVAVGGAAVHALAYRLASSPHGHEHGSAAAGRWYVCAALCGGIALLALGGLALGSARGGGRFGTPVWLVALVPPAGFAVQEQLGRVLHDGALPALPAQTSFALGLLLQIPVALLALLLVRALLRTAAVLVRALRPPVRSPRAPRATRRRPAWLLHLRPLPALALGYGERGPPRLAAA
jgi:hypothetical protein